MLVGEKLCKKEEILTRVIFLQLKDKKHHLTHTGEYYFLPRRITPITEIASQIYLSHSLNYNHSHQSS